MQMSLKKLLQIITLSVIVAIFSINIAVFMHPFAMQMDKDGKMAGCIFNGMNEICAMSLQEHLAAWQTLFAAIPVKATTSILATLLLSMIFINFSIESLSENLINLEFKMRRLHVHFKKEFSFSSSLQEAFSQGILNTKIY